MFKSQSWFSKTLKVKIIIFNKKLTQLTWTAAMSKDSSTATTFPIKTSPSGVVTCNIHYHLTKVCDILYKKLTKGAIKFS